MKIYAINGSPRKKWNTAEILENILQGAAAEVPGIERETVNLYDYDYKGCHSCFECKRLGGPSYGKCAIKDGIYPVMRNVLEADMVVFGSPIYFSDITGMMRCFLERLLFPCFVYDKNYSSIAPRKIATGFIYTMNVPKEKMASFNYEQMLAPMQNFISHVFGSKTRTLYVNDTYQFSDYAKYKSDLFSETEKAKQRAEQFPLDCRNARELGAALVADAKGEPLGLS